MNIIHTGFVTRFNEQRGTGIITSDVDGTEFFVHVSEIRDAGGYRNLEEGQYVEFALWQSPHGPRAAEVRPL